MRSGCDRVHFSQTTSHSPLDRIVVPRVIKLSITADARATGRLAFKVRVPLRSHRREHRALVGAAPGESAHEHRDQPCSATTSCTSTAARRTTLGASCRTRSHEAVEKRHADRPAVERGLNLAVEASGICPVPYSLTRCLTR